MIDRDDYAVRLLDLPADVGGFIAESPDGFKNIYINARHSRAGQRRSFRHELRHADYDDLHSDEPLETIEARANGEDLRLQSIPKLVRARDLMPKPPPPPLTRRQQIVLRNALAELDALRLNDELF